MSSGRRIAVAIAAVLVIGVGWVATRGAPPNSDAASQLVDEWLTAITEQSGDRGWSLLSDDTKAAVYADDPERYWQDLRAVDWSLVTWAPANGHVDDGVFYSGNVPLLSHPSTLPAVLLDRHLAGPFCIDDLPYGIYVQMRLGWFNAPRIEIAGSGGFNGYVR